MNVKYTKSVLSNVMSDEFDVINVDKWPIVNINLQRVPREDAEIDRFQARFTAILNLAKKGSTRVSPSELYILMTLDGIVGASLHQQLLAANFIANVRHLVKDTIKATALIIKNETARMLLEVITKIQPLQSEHRIFLEEADAESWLVVKQTEYRAIHAI